MADNEAVAPASPQEDKPQAKQNGSRQGSPKQAATPPPAGTPKAGTPRQGTPANDASGNSKGNSPVPEYAKPTLALLANTKSRSLLEADPNPWLTQTSPTYVAKVLQNYRVPNTPKEIKGFKEDRPCEADGTPRFLVHENGHLQQRYKKPGRTAFRDVDPASQFSFRFTPQGYI
mmetsp:Transcript_16428/g.39093  ORF Transcript_16428/g.39093 Transcript_16428/m.39093 type:complete len:174 (-) Transcript_16428:44-565(-)